MASGGAREESEASVGGIEGERGFERGRWDRAERGAVTALRGNGRERLDRGIRLGLGGRGRLGLGLRREQAWPGCWAAGLLLSLYL